MLNLNEPSLIKKFENSLIYQGKLDFLVKQLPSSGKILVLKSKSSISDAKLNQLMQGIGKSRVICYPRITPNPTFWDIEIALRSLRQKEIGCIVSIGAGSVIDTGKLLSIMLCLNEYALDEVILDPSLLEKGAILPHFVVPTTSGSGSEVTPFATIWDAKEKTKHSMDHENLYPCCVFLDPDLTLSNSRVQTLYSGLDTISHALESLWNVNKTCESEFYAITSLKYVLEAFLKVLDDLGNYAHRQDMQLASLYAGMAISRTRTAIAHSISYPLTMRHKVPHGLASGFCLIALIDFYKEVEGSKLKNHEIIESVRNVLIQLHLKSEILKYLQFEDVLILLSEMKNPQRFKNFPYRFEEVDLIRVLANSFGKSTDV